MRTTWFKARVTIVAILALSILIYTVIDFISSQHTIEDVRKINLGDSTEKLTLILGEPYRIEIQSGYEEWYYRYYTKNTNMVGLVIDIQNNKVINLNSY